jgi:hypothetical protein
MELPIPSWFKYRQGTAEPAGDNCYRLSAPVSDPAFIRIREINGKWQAAVAGSVDGPDLQATNAALANPHDAWLAAFELYRTVRIY